MKPQNHKSTRYDSVGSCVDKVDDAFPIRDICKQTLNMDSDTVEVAEAENAARLYLQD